MVNVQLRPGKVVHCKIEIESIPSEVAPHSKGARISHEINSGLLVKEKPHAVKKMKESVPPQNIVMKRNR